MTVAYLGLGANLGKRRDTINRAVDILRQHHKIEVKQVSTLIETEAVSVNPQPGYLNGVCCIETTVSVDDLFRITQKIESHLGRQKKGDGSSRTIDIDLLLYGDNCINRTDLVVPHPRMHERDFVLDPLFEITPDLVHPVFKVMIRELRQNIKNREKRIAYEG